MSRFIAHRLIRYAARRARLMLCVALLGTVLAGCSSTGGSPVMFFADPGKYQYHNCQQLTTAHKALSVREQELRDLIERAERSAGGAFVGVIAYRSDYMNATEELRVIDEAARVKNCPPLAPPPPPPWHSSTVIQ